MAAATTEENPMRFNPVFKSRHLRGGAYLLLAGTTLGAGLILSAIPAGAMEIAPVSNPVASSFAPPSMPPGADQTWHLDMIGAGVAYTRGFTGAGVTVAVGDTGFQTDHPALAGTFDLSRTYSNLYVQGEIYDPAYVGFQDPEDGHGTHVSGIIAGNKDPSIWEGNGVAHDARVVPIRMLFSDHTAKNGLGTYVVAYPSMDGIDYFTSLADVKIMNASFGPSPDPTAPPQAVWYVHPSSPYEASAVYRALSEDKIIVAANGNDREKHSVAGLNPSGISLLPYIRPEHANTGVYDDGGYNFNFSGLLELPGQVVAVMSVGRDKTPAYYSNLCGVAASWCLAAPGGDQKPGMNNGVFSPVPTDSYDFYQGTSMAAPVVTGALAVLQSAYPDYSARELTRLMFSTTEDLGLAGLDAVYGHGLVRLDRATDGPTALLADHIETVAADTTAYWSQPLATSSGFTKDGDGILTISGRTNAAGNVFATQGILSVDGTLSVGAGSTLDIGPGAQLSGFGNINADTFIAGVLSPGKTANISDLVANGTLAPGATLVGNSAGVLSFNGNVTLAGSANTRIEMDGTLLIPGGPGTYSRIFVTGAGNTFVAGGALTPVLRDSIGTLSGYTPGIGSRLQIIEAADGARTAGSFSSLTQPTDGLPANGRFDVIYNPYAITLAVTPVSFAGLGSDAPLSPLQQRIAGILDGHRPAAGVNPGASKALYDALYMLDTTEGYTTALDDLGSPAQPANNAAAFSAFGGFLGAIGDRQNMLSLGGGGSQAGSGDALAYAMTGSAPGVIAREAEAAFASLRPAAADAGWGVWGQAFGRWGTVKDSGALAGSTSRSAGFALGADRRIAPDVSGGIAFGFARTSSGSGPAHATFDSYTGALYGSWTPGRAVFDLRAAIGSSDMRTTRSIALVPGTIAGSARGIGGGVSAEAGYLIPFMLGTAKPFVGLSWQGLRRDGYAETQQPFGLTYPAQSFDKLTTTVGIAVSTEQRLANGATIMPEFKLAWGHDLRDTTLVSQAALLDTPFTIEGAKPGRDAALFGFRLAGWTQENFRLFAAYNGEFRSNATSHQVTGGARYTW